MANRQFVFLNNSDTLIAALKQMLEFVETNLPASTRAGKTIFNAKVVLTELLTNSIKHSGSSDTLITIEARNSSLLITKTDTGNPLSLIDNDLSSTKKPITNDILHTLYAVSERNDHLHFVCEENKMEDILAIDDIVEHFGLLIITKAADNFTYSYDHSTKSNIFKVILNY